VFKHNADLNLIPEKEENSIFVRHFCDSIQPLLLFGFKKGATILDIGAGGGFPSIPICVFRPDISFTLSESNRKRVAFLKEVIAELKLENVTVASGKIEKMAVPEQKFDYVISRGVGTMQKLAQIGLPYLSQDGRIYTYKNRSFTSELEEITNNKERDGVRINEIAEYDLGSLVSGLNLVSLERN
jgi:16S rRNA (guanine527-N7)-methyltransferase